MTVSDEQEMINRDIVRHVVRSMVRDRDFIYGFGCWTKREEYAKKYNIDVKYLDELEGGIIGAIAKFTWEAH